MNRRPSGLKLSKALVGFPQYKAAEGFQNTSRGSQQKQLQVVHILRGTSNNTSTV